MPALPLDAPSNFIKQIIAKDLEANKNNGCVVTRFPPEPNGYLHMGHAKSICLNFGIALENKGVCYLRFDDTNPSKESLEYLESIKNDIKWLGLTGVNSSAMHPIISNNFTIMLCS
jgi:glutaminyl-tRNA synthetase